MSADQAIFIAAIVGNAFGLFAGMWIAHDDGRLRSSVVAMGICPTLLIIVVTALIGAVS